MIDNNYYVYSKRYNSITDIRYRIINSLKYNLRVFFSKNKYTKKYLDEYEVYTLNKEEFIDKSTYVESFRLDNDEPYIYEEFQLKNLIFFDVIEIDDFDRYKKKIISQFSKNQFIRSIRDKDDLKQKLDHLKDNLDTVQLGKLFSVNFKNKGLNSDLISSVSLSYVKTSESYFILKVSVKPSDKFKAYFQEIVSSKDGQLATRHYNSFFNIIKTKRFISYTSFQPSLKCVNIDKLIADIGYQVKFNVTKHFKGLFYKLENGLPRIEFYSVGDINNFKKDEFLKYNFDTGFDGYYTLEDNGIEIYYSNYSKEKQDIIQVVKQKGHGKRVVDEFNETDYDYMESYYLLESLAFPCVFRALLNDEFNRLNKLKRKVYDFTSNLRSKSILKYVFIFRNNHRYIRLKGDLTRILMTTKRFENEFTKDRIYFYSKHFFDLQLFSPKDKRGQNQDQHKNLLKRVVLELDDMIKLFDQKTKSLNEIFKNIEELNSYRTNYILQIVSLFIAVLAFIFTFEKTKNVFLWILNFCGIN